MRFIPAYRVRPLSYVLVGLTYTATARAWFSIAILLTVLQVFGIEILRNQPIFLKALFAPFLAWVVGFFIKKVVSRSRPAVKLDDYVTVIEAPSCKSFPSSHSSSSSSFFFALLVLGHPWAPVAGFWAFLIAFSRYYLGVHFPTDILGGSILGVLCASIVTFVIQALG